MRWTILLAAALAGGTHGVTAAAAEPPPDPAAAEPDYERLLAKAELLGMLSGRYGLDLEIVTGRHDSLAFYPFVIVSESSGTASFIELDPDYTYLTKTRAGGLDFLYRRSFGTERGGRGGFLAPGFEVQHFETDTTTYCASSFGYNNPGSSCPTSPANHQGFTYFGPSFDIGGQVILPFGLVLMASAGLHYRFVAGSVDTSHMPWSWGVSNDSGLRPRFRLEIGWAFL